MVSGLELEGPILLPPEEFLAPIMRPYNSEELAIGRRLAEQHGLQLDEDLGPIEFIGTGSTTNAATENAFDRAESVLGLPRAELRNRCTATGGVQVGRLGTVRLGLLAPLRILDRRHIGSYVREQYGLSESPAP